MNRSVEKPHLGSSKKLLRVANPKLRKERFHSALVRPYAEPSHACHQV